MNTQPLYIHHLFKSSCSHVLQIGLQVKKLIVIKNESESRRDEESLISKLTGKFWTLMIYCLINTKKLLTKHS